MTDRDKLALIGHLQVMDVPLSSLYGDTERGMLYLFVRVFDDGVADTYVLCEVTPEQVGEYMDGNIGLRQIFGNGNAYRYGDDFAPADDAMVRSMLENSGCDDMFDAHMAYHSLPLRHYLRTISI